MGTSVTNLENQRDAQILSIGHSNLPLESFISLLENANVEAVADVRSSPRSAYFPQYDRDALQDQLRDRSLHYVFLGKELGGRPTHSSLYQEGVADYEKMANTREFAEGIQRLIEGSKRFRIALMCSEHDPLDCHRCLLVARALKAVGIDVQHLFQDGHLESQRQIEERLLKSVNREGGDLFAPHEELVAIAYRDRAKKVAFRLDTKRS